MTSQKQSELTGVAPVKSQDNTNKQKDEPTIQNNPEPSFPFLTILSESLILIHNSFDSKDNRFTLRALRQLPGMRKIYNPKIHIDSIKILSESSNKRGLSSNEKKNNNKKKEFNFYTLLEFSTHMTDSNSLKFKDEQEEENLAQELTNFSESINSVLLNECLPEIIAFNSILILTYLISQKKYNESATLSHELLNYLQQLNRRSLDMLIAKVYFYHSWAYELSGNLSDTRPELLTAYRTACLHRDLYSQATLLNLILRNYLHYNQYELAFKLVKKTAYPENLPSNAQHARFLFYFGKILAVQLEYSEAYNNLILALRKAPQKFNSGLGFRLAATKIAIIVELLMGDIPDRSTFNQKDLRNALQPYMNIVLAVKSGDLQAFSTVIDTYQNQFQKDQTLFLIKRLHQSVIRAGLRRLNLSYSKITMRDIANRLGLETSADIESIISKAILDGVIEGVINHEEQYIEFKSQTDIYSTNEPMEAFNRRIAFCLKLYSDTVKAMKYPVEQEKSIETQANLLNELRHKKVSNDEMDAM